MKLDVLNTGLLGVAAGECKHLIGHVQAVRLAGRADTSRGEQNVDPAARSEVEDCLALVELGDRGWVTAAEGGECCGIG